MRASDFFAESADPTGWDMTPVLDESMVESLRQGRLSGTSDVSAALALLDLVHEELEVYGTRRGERLADSEMALVIRALEAVTGRVGAPLQLPFRDFTRFRSYWIRQGAAGAGGWQARTWPYSWISPPSRSRREAKVGR